MSTTDRMFMSIGLAVTGLIPTLSTFQLFACLGAILVSISTLVNNWPQNKINTKRWWKSIFKRK